MKPVVLDVNAEAELVAAAEHYEAERDGLGLEFGIEAPAHIGGWHNSPGH